METTAIPSERTGERSRLRFWGFVFLIGPLPVVLLTSAVYFELIVPRYAPALLCISLGALWGLAFGIRMRQLSRAIVGLNLGVVLGFLNETILAYSGWDFVSVTTISSTSMGILTGILRTERPGLIRTFVAGFCVGFGAVSLLAIVFGVLLFMIIDRVPLALEKMLLVSALALSSAACATVLLTGAKRASDERREDHA